MDIRVVCVCQYSHRCCARESARDGGNLRWMCHFSNGWHRLFFGNVDDDNDESAPVPDSQRCGHFLPTHCNHTPKTLYEYTYNLNMCWYELVLILRHIQRCSFQLPPHGAAAFKQV